MLPVSRSQVVCIIGVVLCFVSPVVFAYGGVTMAFCKNTQHGKWRRIIQEMFLEIPFRIEPVDCGDVGSAGMALMIRYSSGHKDTITRTNEQSEEQFFATVIGKISPDRISPLKDSLEESLKGLEEAVVVFVKEDTKEDFIFQQALITPFLSKDITVFKITKKSMLTDDMKKDVSKNLHIWIITGQERHHVLLPYNSPNKIKLYLIGVFNRLKFPLKFKYEDDDAYSKYKGAGFNFFTVYHHADQEEEVNTTIIGPLVNAFRPFFVFVTVDVDKYQLPQTVKSNAPLPLVVVTRDGQRAGVAISSEDTHYTKENFVSILRSVVDPEIDQELEEDNMFGLYFPDKLNIPSTIPSLTTATYEDFVNENSACLIAFYLHYTLKSKALLFHLMNVIEMMQSAGMPSALVNCAKYPDVCETFGIHQFPTVKYRRGSDSKWVTYDGVLSSIDLLKLAHNTQSNEQETQKSIVELSPTSLIKVMKTDGLTQLLILVAEVITDDLESILSDLTDQDTVYWLNSTQYRKLSDFLIGLSLAPPPVLVLADYNKHYLYRFDLKQPGVTKQEIKQFLRDVSEGRRKPDSEVTPTNWKPVAPPLNFPSGHFLASLQSTNGNTEEQNKGLIDQQPLYADPNRYTYDEPSQPDATMETKQQPQKEQLLHNHQEL